MLSNLVLGILVIGTMYLAAGATMLFYNLFYEIKQELKK